MHFCFTTLARGWRNGLVYRAFQSVKRHIRKNRRDHASYNVAKKVLAFVYQVAIPRSHLRASYGDGFLGAPLRCICHQEEGSFTRVAGESEEQASSQERQEVGGADHV